MSSDHRSAATGMNLFERYLTLWVFLCIGVGVLLGRAAPDFFQFVGGMEIAHVNVPVGLLIWVMIIPMLVKVDFGALHEVRRHLKGFGVTLFINWLVKPFSMAFLGWLFIRHLFAPLLPVDQLDSYVAGLILLAAAPCTAMVFVWSRLSDGDPLFTLSQVALNDLIMVFAFAPLVAFLLGLSSITPPWETLLTSVVLYIVLPVIVSQLLRRNLLARGEKAFDKTMAAIAPWSVSALLLTLILLFAFQGEALVRQPLIIILLAIPILIQVFFNAGLAYGLNRAVGGVAQHRRPLRPYRRLQLFRVGGRGGDQSFRFRLRRGARHRRRRAGGGPGHVGGGEYRQPDQRVVRTGGVAGRVLHQETRPAPTPYV